VLNISIALPNGVDDREDYGVERISLQRHDSSRGVSERVENIRIISPKRAAKHQRHYYSARIRLGTLWKCCRIAPNANFSPSPAANYRGSDCGGRTCRPDTRPVSPEELRSAKRIPRTKSLRRPLTLHRRNSRRNTEFPSGTYGIGNTGAVSQTSRPVHLLW
jgi:hypothetical protein